MLFGKYSIFDVLTHESHKLKEKIETLEPNYVLNTSEEDLVAWLVDQFNLDVPAVDESRIEMSYEDTRIDVSGGARSTSFEHTGPMLVPGTRVTLSLPFTGNASFFEVRPQQFTYGSSGSKAALTEDELQFTYAGANLDGAAAKRDFESDVQMIKKNLESLNTSISQHNAQLEQTIRQQVAQRKRKLLNDAHMAASLGYPMKRRDGMPSTYAVPVHKRTPRMAPPPASLSSFKPEPALAMEEYESILEIIRNMVHVMERSPKAFEHMGEEDLRTHFLVQLNGQYEGKANGETFNFQGKTDILIREGDRNVFIAECKFWKGEKQFLETIDQLLSYVSWRDIKTAVIVFNRNANFSDVLKKIEEITPKHKHYKRTSRRLDESSFRYIFHQPNDSNREIVVTLMTFDVPTPEHRSKKVKV